MDELRQAIIQQLAVDSSGDGGHNLTWFCQPRMAFEAKTVLLFGEGTLHIHRHQLDYPSLH